MLENKGLHKVVCECCGETKYLVEANKENFFICYECTLDLYKNCHDAVNIDSVNTTKEL